MNSVTRRDLFGGALLYRPPYDSPLEDLFAYNFEKYGNVDISLDTQVEIVTFCGKFRLDFLMTLPGARSVAVECDGNEFHDASRDEWRDAVILGASNIAAIYRLPGSALFYHTSDCLYVLSLWEKWMFSDRGRLNLRTLASEQVIAVTAALGETGVHLRYTVGDGPRSVVRCELARHSLQDRFLRTALAFALRSGCTDLDEVCARYRSPQAEQ